MIEYALLFALGFLAATLAGLMIAPAVQKRVVKFTENRMKATMPLSPQEVRAQKDMARAAFAVENARLSQDVVREREKASRLMVNGEVLLRETGKLAAENADLQAQIADMNVEAGDMRSALRREEQKLEQMKAALDASDRANQQKLKEIAVLDTRIERLLAEVDDMKIDLATRGTEIENLKSRIGGLRDERDKLRDDLKAAAGQMKETQLKLSREEGRARQLETRLSREIAGSADKDNVIERRIAEVNRLRDKLKTNTTEAKEAARASKATGLARIMRNERLARQKDDEAEEPAIVDRSPIDISAMEEDVRNQSAALSERLLSATSDATDAAMREEIADIAAKMIVLTAAREGKSSPVHDLLATAETSQKSGRRSLASRARADLRSPDE